MKTGNIRESFLMQGRERQESESLTPSKVVVTCTNCRLTVTRFFFILFGFTASKYLSGLSMPNDLGKRLVKGNVVQDS